MGTKGTQIRRLSPREKREVEKAFRSRSQPRVREWAQIIRLADKGKATDEIAEVVGRSRTTVWRRIREFNECGVDALQPGKSPGAPPKADKRVRAALMKAVKTDPLEMGYTFTIWTAPLLAHFIWEELDVEISAKSVYRILHEEGFRFSRPKLDLAHRQDPDAVAKAKRQKGRAKKKSATAEVVVLSRFSTRRKRT